MEQKNLVLSQNEIDFILDNFVNNKQIVEKLLNSKEYAISFNQYIDLNDLGLIGQFIELKSVNSKNDYFVYKLDLFAFLKSELFKNKIFEKDIFMHDLRDNAFMYEWWIKLPLKYHFDYPNKRKYISMYHNSTLDYRTNVRNIFSIVHSKK